MAKTKADLEKELKAKNRESKALQKELHAALLKIAAFEKAPTVADDGAKMAKENATMKKRLRRLVADNNDLAIKNAEYVRAVNLAKSMCGMLPTKIEASAWGHTVLGHLGEEYVAEMKRFSES